MFAHNEDHEVQKPHKQANHGFFFSKKQIHQTFGYNHYMFANIIQLITNGFKPPITQRN